MRARGLKLGLPEFPRFERRRAPMRARGLKLMYLLSKLDYDKSRPHAGAWIEILRVGRASGRE